MPASLRCTLATIVLCLLAGSPDSRPPADGFSEDDCKPCADTGLIPCRKCAKRACATTVRVLHCSARAECKACGGLQEVPCKRCEEVSEERLEELRASDSAWLEEARKIDAFIEEELLHAESEHFFITYDIAKIGVKGVKTPHDGMHLYLGRLEALFELFVQDLAASPEEDFTGKTHVLLWDREKNQERASLEYTRQPSNTQSKLMGAAPVVSLFYDKGWLHDEEELHQALVHQVAHCLLSNVYDGIWPGNVNGGWIDGGLAHYYEVSLFGSVRNYCYVEGDTMIDFKNGRWEPAVRQAVDGDDFLPFIGVTGKHTTELSPEEHMFAWSFVDFVLRDHPGSFGSLARSIKARNPSREAVKSVFSMSPFEFEAAWKEFVVREYSLKPKRR